MPQWPRQSSLTVVRPLCTLRITVVRGTLTSAPLSLPNTRGRAILRHHPVSIALHLSALQRSQASAGASASLPDTAVSTVSSWRTFKQLGTPGYIKCDDLHRFCTCRSNNAKLRPGRRVLLLHSAPRVWAVRTTVLRGQCHTQLQRRVLVWFTAALHGRNSPFEWAGFDLQARLQCCGGRPSAVLRLLACALRRVVLRTSE